MSAADSVLEKKHQKDCASVTDRLILIYSVNTEKKYCGFRLGIFVSSEEKSM